MESVQNRARVFFSQFDHMVHTRATAGGENTRVDPCVAGVSMRAAVQRSLPAVDTCYSSDLLAVLS